jgi:hypothetical protein
MKLKYANREERTERVSEWGQNKGRNSTDDDAARAIASRFDAAIALVRMIPDDAESD